MVEPSESLSGCVIGASTALGGDPASADGANPRAIAPLASNVPAAADHRLAAKLPVTCRLIP